MAGYWPSSFFACLWTETESRSIRGNRSLISSHLDRTALANKGFIIGKKKFFLRGAEGNSERQDGAILPARVANHSTHNSVRVARSPG